MIFFIDEEAFREGKVMIWLNCFYFFIFFCEHHSFCSGNAEDICGVANSTCDKNCSL